MSGPAISTPSASAHRPTAVRRLSAVARPGASIAGQLGLVAVVMGLWWFYSRNGRVPGILLPPIEDVMVMVPDLVTTPTVWSAIGVTGLSVTSAFVASAGGGLLVGFVAGRTHYGTRLVEMWLVWAQSVPLILLYPVIVLVFGLGPSSKIVFAGIYGFFPIALNAVRGIDAAPLRFRQAAASMGASRWQLLRYVQLPAARPMILSGLRLTAALNFLAVIAGEILASSNGIGYLIANASYGFRVAEMYGYIIIALVLVVVFNRAVTRAEDRTVVF